MKLAFLGATRTVTGSKYLLTVDSQKILVDCGLFQGHQELRQRNWAKFPVSPAEIDAVILTHAHIDHSGYLPRLIKNGFKGDIYCTHGTKELCAILLPDSGFLQEEDAYRANKYGYTKHRPALPLYTKDDGVRAINQFVPLDFRKPCKLSDSLSFTFLPAGHILGASMVQFHYHGKTVLFSGDLGRPHHLIMTPPTIVTHTDYLILESTYGNRLHSPINALDELAKIIHDTLSRQGSIIIPAFAVGRAQDLLYLLSQLKDAKRIPNIPIFLDSPMAQDVSDLLIHYSNEHRLSKDQCKKLCQIATYTKTPEESKEINTHSEPVLIISASGMIEGGRILHHLKLFLPDSRNSILLTGYQAPGTRGEQLLHGNPTIKIHGESIPVHAQIHTMQNMSAHADYQEILTWLGHFKQSPQKVFLTHGDLSSSEALKDKIEKKLGWSCLIPDYLHTEILH
ncbi:MAG: mRNA 3'-end processing factor [Legionellales bacterium RIFCSPHIGHO2_12_FULL_42_9]|nr:MAG: mRNA 3'-end processing factor [Legionellales bacterium RIFCSPHIGHO2_12_FULL_42_9]